MNYLSAFIAGINHCYRCQKCGQKTSIKQTCLQNHSILKGFYHTTSHIFRVYKTFEKLILVVFVTLLFVSYNITLKLKLRSAICDNDIWVFPYSLFETTSLAVCSVVFKV